MNKNKVEIIWSYLINNFLGLLVLTIAIVTYKMEWIWFFSLFLVWLLISLLIFTYWNYKIYKKDSNIGMYLIIVFIIMSIYDNYRHDYISEHNDWIIIVSEKK